MKICEVGFGTKSSSDQYWETKEFIVPPSFSKDSYIEVGAKVVINPYKNNRYYIGEILDVREDTIALKEVINKKYIIDVVDFRDSDYFEKMKREYHLLQKIADTVKLYKDYSDYPCDINLESTYNLDSVEQSVVLHFGSPIDPSPIFWETFNKEDSEFNDEE